ncbi:MAG: ribonuclease M5 [Bacillota bacterium]|nr:ribonuclease M5 [Bacillota bacterium]
MDIKETIVVEGRDDTAAIKRSLDALTIETHGFGIRNDTWSLIEKAYETTGIIVFTDPDHAGEQIRKRILERFPRAKEAFLDVDEATKDGDIGIENAKPEDIRRALSKVKEQIGKDEASSEDKDRRHQEFTSQDMFNWGLTGSSDSAELRHRAGRALGVGFANGKTFLQRLNKFGISRAEVEKTIAEILAEDGRK